jgi:hypothetical protein
MPVTEREESRARSELGAAHAPRITQLLSAPLGNLEWGVHRMANYSWYHGGDPTYSGPVTTEIANPKWN